MRYRLSSRGLAAAATAVRVALAGADASEAAAPGGEEWALYEEELHIIDTYSYCSYIFVIHIIIYVFILCAYVLYVYIYISDID